MNVYFEKIHFYRKKRKITAKGLCELCKFGRTTLWDWEHGRYQPDEGKIKAIATALNVSVNDISDLPIDNNLPVNEYNKKVRKTVSDWLNLLDDDKNLKEVNNIIELIAIVGNKISNSSVITKALMKSLHAIFYIKDVNLKYVIANKAFLDNVSLKENYDVTGQHDYDFFPKTEAKENIEEDKQVLLTGKHVTNREDYIPGSRKKKWGMISKFPIISADNKILGVIAMISDITDIRIANKKRMMLEGVIDQMEDTCISIGRYLDKDGDSYVFDYINSTMKKIFSIEKPEEYKNIPKLWSDMLPEESRSIFDKRMKIKKNPENLPAHFVYKTIRSNDNKEIWVQDSIYRSGNRWVSIVRDITELKESEEQRMCLEEGINSMDLCVWSGKRVNGKFIGTYVSDSVESFTNINKNIFLKNPEEIWLNCVHQNDIDIVLKGYKMTKYPISIEYRLIKKKDRKIRYVREHTNVFGNKYVTIIEDITEKKLYEKKKELINFCVQKMASGFAIVDICSQKFEYINEDFAKIFNCSVADMYKISAGEWYIKYLHPEDRIKKLSWSEIRNSKKIKQIRIITSDNITRYVSVKTNIKKYAKKLCAILTVDDIANQMEEKNSLNTVLQAKTYPLKNQSSI